MSSFQGPCGDDCKGEEDKAHGPPDGQPTTSATSSIGSGLTGLASSVQSRLAGLAGADSVRGNYEIVNGPASEEHQVTNAEVVEMT